MTKIRTVFAPVRGDSTVVHLIEREHVQSIGLALCGASPPEGSRGALRWRRVGAPSEKTCNACFAIASANPAAEIELRLWAKQAEAAAAARAPSSPRQLEFGWSVDTPTKTRNAEGQYNHGLDKVCVCGHRKGEHDAERPYSQEDPFVCAGFKAAKVGNG